MIENFSESPKILKKSTKILTKVMTKDDLEQELLKSKNCSDILDRDDDQKAINDAKVSSNLIHDSIIKRDGLKEIIDKLRYVANLNGPSSKTLNSMD